MKTFPFLNRRGMGDAVKESRVVVARTHGNIRSSDRERKHSKRASHVHVHTRSLLSVIFLCLFRSEFEKIRSKQVDCDDRVSRFSKSPKVQRPGL